jgi:hypothetical protein
MDATMTGAIFEMSKKPFRSLKTVATADAIAADCRALVIVAGGERHWNDTRESWLARAAWRLGITPGRAASLFYGKARAIRADEYLLLRARAATLHHAAERRQEGIDEVARRLLAVAGEDAGPAVDRRPAEGRGAGGAHGEPR